MDDHGKRAQSSSQSMLKMLMFDLGGNFVNIANMSMPSKLYPKGVNHRFILYGIYIYIVLQNDIQVLPWILPWVENR